MAKSRVEKIRDLADKIDALVSEATDEELDSCDIPVWITDSIIAVERSQRDYDRSI